MRPTLPPSQIGSWQSPPTQQPSRFNQNRPRSSWSQQQAPRGRAPITPPNVPTLAGGHPGLQNFSQQPRSILKKPLSNETSSSDLLYMSPSDLSGMNEQRTGTNFAPAPPPPATSRLVSSPGMYDDNDDDSSPQVRHFSCIDRTVERPSVYFSFQAQLVIDTSSNTTNNVLLPYTIVPGSNSSSNTDSFEPSHDNHSMVNASQQQQLYGDDNSSILD